MKIILLSIGTRGDIVWNKIICKLVAGPKGIKIGKISAKNLEPKILELVNNGSFKKKAEHVATQMRKEHYRKEINESIIKK